jgi:hypothetical protein
MKLSEWRRWWHLQGESELRALLLEEWDPIGVGDLPEAANEYDSYALPLATKLREGGTETDVFEYLVSARVSNIGLLRDDPVDHRVAQTIVAWYQAAMAEPRRLTSG